ncbi:Deleted in lung and esophageal cancer protein 1 [Physocladia obscura]|uniref:Deleted in lung and esophageal cancer protein 1 n=1 Tax=Physocladia obscura TaxID=109957 RepID=A0AAD5XIF2_9FUNG|nr:Deleted in lung and esophageal cancer protein 1 [Physocladia obscura]
MSASTTVPQSLLPIINEPGDGLAVDENILKKSLRKWGSVPSVKSRQGHFDPAADPLAKKVVRGFAHAPSKMANNSLIRSKLDALSRSNIELSQITHRAKNLQSSSYSSINVPWIKEIDQSPEKLPKGVSLEFSENLSLLETQRQETIAYLKNWADIQVKALESLVGANKGLPSTETSNPVTPNNKQTNTPKNLTPGKTLKSSSSNKLSASTTKLKLSTAKIAKSNSSFILAGSNIRDPRTGVIIGEENVTLLSLVAAQHGALPIFGELAEANTLSNNLLMISNDEDLKKWRQLFSDPSFNLTPIFVSEVLLKIANTEQCLETLRESLAMKSDWVSKIIREREDIIARIGTLNFKISAASENVEWVKSERNYIRSKSMMVSTVFSDYAQDSGLKFPVLRLPKIDYISDYELLQLGAPTLGIFNQIRNVMISRMDNGLKNNWINKINLSDNCNVPGVLEVDASEIQSDQYTPRGALEPRKIIFHPKTNSMKPFNENEAKLLKAMRTRLNFLRNPRFPKAIPIDCIGILRDDTMPASTNPTISSTESTNKALKSMGGGIVAIPSSISFTNYLPFQKYSKILTIKNRSSHSVRFRLSVPPPYEYSKFFNITMMSSPASGDGLVAPGMGCQYHVEFFPKTLANYEQLLIVFTESGVTCSGLIFEPFTILLSGTRAAPELTIPDVLHCGPCRDGFVAIRRWKFKNVGGTGRFMILDKFDGIDVAQMFADVGQYEEEAQYIAAILNKSSHPKFNPLIKDSFEISPKYFALTHGESAEITVKYNAALIDDELLASVFAEAKFYIACDNCQVLELPVRANIQKASVKITQCVPSNMRVLDEDVFDIKGVKFIFGNQNLAATTKLNLTVRNLSRLKLPFVWVPVDNPGFNPEKQKNYSVSSFDSNLSLSDAFAFFPESGEFNPNSEIVFEITFTPSRVKKYDVIGRLLLLEEGSRILQDNNGFQIIDSNDDTFKIEQECVLEIFLNGQGLNYSVQVKPELILIPGIVYINEIRCTHIAIFNSSISPVTYEWVLEEIDNEILDLSILQHDSMIVQPGESLSFKVFMKGLFPGKINGVLLCKIANKIGPLIRIPVIAEVGINPADLIFDSEFINFGLIALGMFASASITLTNSSKYTIAYQLLAFSSVEDNNFSKTQLEPWYISFSDSNATLLPGESKKIKLVFIPTWYQSFRGILTCEILRGNRKAVVTAVNMLAEVQTPYVTIDTTGNCIAYVNVPFNFDMALKNMTMLKTKFLWNTKIYNCKNFTVQFESTHGELNPLETKLISAIIVFKEIEMAQTVEFECVIDGMVQNGGIVLAALTADVFGFAVQMKVAENPDLEGENLKLDFGNDCPIFESRTRTLIIRNKSAIASPYRIWIENYSALDVNQWIADEVSEKGTQARPQKLILRPTEKPKIGFNSATGKQWLENVTIVRQRIAKTNQVLREGRGVAFHPTPSHGILNPFSLVKITVTSYNNLVGMYSDNLVFEVGPWIRKIIPLTMGVDGVPVKFSGAQLVVSKNQSKVDRINFGTQIVQHRIRLPLPPFGENEHHTFKKSRVSVVLNQLNDTSFLDSASVAQVIKKEILVENQSPRTIFLRWNIFTKRQPLSSVTAQQNTLSTPSNDEIDNMLLDELITNNPLTSPVVIQPAPMIIPAFKIVSARISFCAHETGYYKSLLVADVGYIQPDGSVTYSPAPDRKQLEDPFFEDNGFEQNLLAPMKRLEKAQIPFPEGFALPRIRKVRLLVQAKVVEPNLIFEEDVMVKDATGQVSRKNSAVWFNRLKDNKILAEALQQANKGATRNSGTNNYQMKYPLQLENEAKIFTDEESPITMIHLRNKSETICSFQINASSSDVFKIIHVEKPQTPHLSTNKFNKKIPIKMNESVLPSLVSSRPISAVVSSSTRALSAELSTSQLASEAPTRLNMPFATPTAARPTTITVLNMSEKQKKLPPLGEEVDDLPSNIVYELNPMEMIRIAVECIDTDILRSTTVEDNLSSEIAGLDLLRKREIDFLGFQGFAKGYLNILFTNGSVQNIPILCHDRTIEEN